MLKNRNIVIVSLVCLVAGISSCKKYLNVNTNPNVAQTATVQTLLPAAELYAASALGVDLEIDGSFWSQYWTQNPNASQYIPLDRYSVGQDAFSTPWANLYSAGENFYQMSILADSQNKKSYLAIAVLMQAYTFQLITDGWGDVPFKNALKGEYASGHIVNPSYDSQLVVYNGILTLIDSANKLLAITGGVVPGADDLIYGGVMSEWVKFSNTLKLRVLLRMSYINPIAAQDSIAALYATAPVFIGEGDDAKINYGYSSANKSPLYGEAVGLGYIQNIIGSNSCIDSMNSNNDDRLYIFYEPAAATGSFAGIPQGQVANNITPSSYSIPNIYVAGDANNSGSSDAPVNFITSYESYFLQAEAAARGWAPGDDSALFIAGIYASFDYYSTQYYSPSGISSTNAPSLNILWAAAGTTSASGDTVRSNIYLTSSFAEYAYVFGDTILGRPAANWSKYPKAAPLAQKLQSIITQKYFSMCGNQGFEAWCELRRTGYPNWLPFPVEASPKSFPKRFLYPTSESTVNLNFPGLQPLQSKVWWDLN